MQADNDPQPNHRPCIKAGIPFIWSHANETPTRPWIFQQPVSLPRFILAVTQRCSSSRTRREFPGRKELARVVCPVPPGRILATPLHHNAPGLPGLFLNRISPECRRRCALEKRRNGSQNPIIWQGLAWTQWRRRRSENFSPVHRGIRPEGSTGW